MSNLGRVLHVTELHEVADQIAVTLSEGKTMPIQDSSHYYFSGSYLACVTKPLEKWSLPDCDLENVWNVEESRTETESSEEIALLQKLAKPCHTLVLWFSGDRRGEELAHQVEIVCKRVNRNMIVCRPLFMSIHMKEIQDAFAHYNLKERQVDTNLAKAFTFEIEINLRIETAFTKYQRWVLQDFDFSEYCSTTGDAYLSYGLCELPILGLIVDRECAVNTVATNNVADKSLKIYCEDMTNSNTTKFMLNHMDEKLKNYEEAKLIHKSIYDNPIAEVRKVSDGTKAIDAPGPLDILELQKRAFRYFGMNAKETMQVATMLYRHGYISSYITWNSRSWDAPPVKNNLYFKRVLKRHYNHPTLGEYCKKLVDNIMPRGSVLKHHTPFIYPTRYTKQVDLLTDNYKKIYELVFHHFLAYFSKRSTKGKSKVQIEMAGHKFAAATTNYVEGGFKDVYPYEGLQNQLQNSYNVTDTFTPTRIRLRCELPHFTDCDIIDRMNKEGLGSDGSLIQNLIDKGYAKREGPHIRPTKLGMALIMGYKQTKLDIWKPEFYREIRDDAMSVSEGLDRAIMVYVWKQRLEKLIKQAIEDKSRFVEEFEAFPRKKLN